MSPGAPSPCPPADELERWLDLGEPLAPIAAHVSLCPHCASSAAQLRDNLRFMDRFVSQMGGAIAPPAPLTAIDPDLLPGYRLVREIARGGQGTVYEGVQLQTKRRVAIKMIPPGEGGSRSQRRLQREAEIVAAMRHPGIVTIYASGLLADGRCALAMEYVDGERLDHWAADLDKSAPPTREGQRAAVEKKLLALAGICDAVQYAHQNGVIHRDLKPANILVNTEGVPRVLDFGIARRVAAETGITRAGGFAGTLAYASPEQVSGVPDAVDTRSDVYSLGLILFELLTGRRPYDTEGSLTGAIANITRAEPATLRTIQPGDQPAGGELEAIARKALAKDRENRYQTAGALKTDLENYLAGRAVDARSHSGWYALRKATKRHRGAVAVVVAFVVLLSAFAAYMTSAAARLDRQRTLLAESLTSSTLEQARLLGLNGSNVRAEALIWPELLRTGVKLDDPGLGFTSPPDATQAAWALFEVLSRHSVLMRVPTAPEAVTVNVEKDNRAVRLLNRDGTTDLIRIPTGEVIEHEQWLPAHTSRVVFDSHAEPRVALMAEPEMLMMVDLKTKKRTDLDHPLLKNLDRITVAVGGERFLTIGEDHALRLWQVQPLKEVATLTTGLSRFVIPRFTSDGQQVISPADSQIGLWRAADGARQGTYLLPADLTAKTVNPMANHAVLSGDGRFMAASLSTWILIYDAKDPGAPPRRIAAHAGFVNYLDFCADSSALLSFGFESTARVWDPATGQMLSSFEQSTGWHGWPTLSPDGRYLALCGNDNVFRLFETRARGWLTRLKGAANTVHTVRISQDGQLLASTSADGSVRVWSLPDRTLLWSTPPDSIPLATLAFTPDGTGLVASRPDGYIRRWDARRGGDATLFLQGPSDLNWLGFSPDGRTFVVTCWDGQIHLYDAKTQEHKGTLSGHNGRAAKIAFSPDSTRLASVGADKLCNVWDIATQKKLLELRGHTAGLRAVTFSPDGTQIATGSDDLTIRLWDAKTGVCTRTITGLKQHVFVVAFHPAGNILFSACRDPAVQVWDVRTGRELALLEGHTDMILSLAIAPDGRTLVTGSADATVGVWDIMYYQKHVRSTK